MSELTYQHSDDEINSLSDITEKSNFQKLSYNRYLTLDWLLKFPNSNWNYKCLSRRYNFNKLWFYAFPDKPWDLKHIICHFDIKLIDILKIQDVENKLDFSTISENPNLSLEWLLQFPRANWDLSKLAKHPHLCLEWFSVIPTHRWDFTQISLNKNFPLCLLDEFPRAKWDFKAISYHTQLNCYWFEEFKDKDWDFDYIQKTYIYTRSKPLENQEYLNIWIRNIPENKLDFEKLSEHPYLSLPILKAFCQAKWNFHKISNRTQERYFKVMTRDNIINKSWLQAFPRGNWDPEALIKIRSFHLSWTCISPQLEWKFNKIWFNPEDVSLKFLITFPDNNLNSNWMRRNNCITVEWLTYIKPTEDNYKKLSYNKKVDLAWLTAFPNAPWDWKLLSNSSNITAKWIETFPDKQWNFSVLSQKINLDLLVLEILPHSPWVFSSLSNNKKLTLKELQQYRNRDWNFNALSLHPNCDLTWLRAFPDKIKHWNFTSLGQNKKFSLEWLKTYPDAEWDFQEISKNRSFNRTWYLTIPHADWDISAISKRKDMKSLIVLLQYNYPNLKILEYFQTYLNISQNRFRNQIISVILLQPQNYYCLPPEYQIQEIFRAAWESNLSQLEKDNVLAVDQAKILIYEIHPELFFNPTTDLVLTDLGGDSYLIPGWFQSKDIMRLIHETLPQLGNIDIYVESFTDKPDQLGSQTYNLHLKYLLFNNPNEPQAMIVYPEQDV